MTSFFSAKCISCTCLLRSGLKLIFHWKVQSLINFKSRFMSLAELLTSWAAKNKEVSSANNLHSLLKQFRKLCIKNKRAKKLNFVLLKTNNGHLKLPFVFCWSRNHLLYQSTLHIYHFEAICKSAQHSRLYQRLLRYQGITLELQDLYRKQLKFHDWWRTVD